MKHEPPGAPAFPCLFCDQPVSALRACALGAIAVAVGRQLPLGHPSGSCARRAFNEMSRLACRAGDARWSEYLRDVEIDARGQH